VYGINFNTTEPGSGWNRGEGRGRFRGFDLARGERGSSKLIVVCYILAVVGPNYSYHKNIITMETGLGRGLISLEMAFR